MIKETKIEKTEVKIEQEKKYPFDALIILSGGLARSQFRGKYHPTDYRHNDDFGMLGGSMRLVAGVALFLQKKSKNLIFSTGITEKNKSQFGDNVPTEAEVYAEKFMKILNAFKKRQEYQKQLEDLEDPEVILENQSSTTLQNIQNVLEIIAQRKWTHVAIISSDYHIPRIKALCEKQLAERNDLQSLKLTFMSAEEVVKDTQPGKYDRLIQEAYQTAAAKLRINNEAQGLRDLEKGAYETRTEFQKTKRYKDKEKGDDEDNKEKEDKKS